MVSRDGDGTIMNNSDGGGGETMITVYLYIYYIHVLAGAEGVANEPIPCSMSDRAERVQRV